MKLVLVGQTRCIPCTVMKNQILDRIEELEALGASFEYIDLNSLDNKETFIHKHKLTATPTTWVEVDGFITEGYSGYVSVEDLFQLVEECK